MILLLKIGFLKSIIKLLLPYEFIYQNLEKDFSNLRIEEDNFKLLKKNFFKIIFLEIQFASFILKIIKNKNLGEVEKFFDMGKNLIEKLVFFLKVKYSTTLGFNQFKLIIFRIRRKGNRISNLEDFFILNTIKNDENIKKIKDIKLHDNFKLEDIDLSANIFNSMLNENKFFVDENPFQGFLNEENEDTKKLNKSSMVLLPVINLKIPDKKFKNIVI